MAGSHRIQFTFVVDGIRYRPTLCWPTTEVNLRRARRHLIGIKFRISTGTFSFAEDFPDYRHLRKVPLAGSPGPAATFSMNTLHTALRASPAMTWRLELDRLRFLDIKFSQLTRIADSTQSGKKTHNNAISVLRRAFKFGYRQRERERDSNLAEASAKSVTY